MSAPIRTRLSTASEEFVANGSAMAALVDEVRGLHDGVLGGGGPQYVERHRARGKLMVRERVDGVVDPGTPVLELSPLAGLHTGDPVGGGVVVALVEIAHTQCLVIANDPTVRGGTTSPTTIKKLLRAMDVAEINRLPLIIPPLDEPKTQQQGVEPLLRHRGAREALRPPLQGYGAQTVGGWPVAPRLERPAALDGLARQ